MFRPLNLEEYEKESQELQSLSENPSNNNNNNNNNHIKKENEASNLLSPNNHQTIVRSHSIGYDMIKNGPPTATKNGEEKNRLAMSLSQPLLNDPRNMERRPLKSAGSGTLDRPDIFYTRSLHNINRSHLSIHGDTDRYGSLRRRSNNQEVDEDVKVCGCIPCSQETHDTIKKMMSFGLLKNPVFILYTVSNFLTR
jgi:MFS transporter, MCT family, solute carrier family 16 (monocarboxylic acid transporters), member 14